MVVVKTAREVTTRVRLLRVILTSLGSKNETPFYQICLGRVNTILNLPAVNLLLVKLCPVRVDTTDNLRGTVPRATFGRFPQLNYLHR
jgi:hypothetical protein